MATRSSVEMHRHPAFRQQRLCPIICILIEFLSCRSVLCCTKKGPIDVHVRSNQLAFCSTIGQRLLPVTEAKKKNFRMLVMPRPKSATQWSTPALQRLFVKFASEEGPTSILGICRAGKNSNTLSHTKCKSWEHFRTKI
jgi:hypothetical protein